MGRPPEIEMRPYDTGKNLERAKLSITGRGWSAKKPARDRAHPVPGGEETFRFAGKQEDSVTASKDDALPMSGATVCGGHASLAYGQGRDVRCESPWW